LYAIVEVLKVHA